MEGVVLPLASILCILFCSYFNAIKSFLDIISVPPASPQFVLPAHLICMDDDDPTRKAFKANVYGRKRRGDKPYLKWSDGVDGMPDRDRERYQIDGLRRKVEMSVVLY